MDKIQQLQQILQSSNNIVFFGGAGVSTESGIKDFRSADGLYNQKSEIPPETILSHEYFMEETENFYKWYFNNMIDLSIKPNAAHYKLAEWEKLGKVKAVITQNIDGLHQLAGSKTVYELHGSVHRNYCMKCHKFYDATYMIQFKDKGVPTCSCGGEIKPDVVLYNEGLNNKTIQNAIDAISSADTLIVAGTSLTVYPAAGLIDYFRGRYLILINKDKTGRDIDTTLTINEPVGKVFSQITLK